MTSYRRLFVAASIAWTALILIAPFAASQSAPARFWYGVAFLVYGAGSVVCHQLPERSFQLWSAQLPVCARCTGIYFGAAAAAIVAAAGLPPAVYGTPVRVTSNTAYVTTLAVAALPTAMTLVYEWTAGDTPSNVIRAIAGTPLGVAVVLVVLRGLGRRVRLR